MSVWHASEPASNHPPNPSKNLKSSEEPATRYLPSTPRSDSHKNTAAQAPFHLALQLRKMAELLGACVKFSFT